jgi:glycosyltransferase involved in cell wall biosynthesis
MRVLHVPDFSARDPYQRLLADALRRQGVESRAASSHRRRALRDILTSGTAILAASFGKAVIAPRRGCLPQTLDERGTLFYDPLVTDALEAALGSAMAADLGSMGAQNRAMASRLDWDLIAERTVQVYRGRDRPSG